MKTNMEVLGHVRPHFIFLFFLRRREKKFSPKIEGWAKYESGVNGISGNSKSLG